MKTLIAAALLVLIGTSTMAASQERDPYNLEGRARILNVDGDWCWLTQTYEKTVADFLKGGLKADVRTIHFDDANCMATMAEGIGDLAETINKSAIARQIGQWWRGAGVQEWIEYDARQRYQPGMLQASGECMMADGMPATAIAIHFNSADDSISDVRWTAVFGCGDPL